MAAAARVRAETDECVRESALLAAAREDFPARASPRDGVLLEAAGTDDGSDAAEPVDPAEPVVSAKAIGTAAIAEPTPSATANKPTRPTYLA